MTRATLQEEKNLWKEGYKFVACLDEAGRGPLAGPVTAAAVMINQKHEARNPKQYLNSNFPNSKSVSNFGFRISDLKLRDSKQLTPKTRERFYKILTSHSEVMWGVGIVSEKMIDKINILEATKLAMVKAVKDLEAKNGYSGGPTSPVILGALGPREIDFLILDGNFKIDSPIAQKSIIKGDEKVFSCAAASIIAKVIRDRIMMKYHKKYPQYGFDKHKGYPTEYHYQMINKYGPCQIHRKSYILYKE
ncbi:MAG: ribonuclease HII [Candidatus Nealsonbacteria bacterium]|nr:ribonuclease HII [Candidatus Nealsonbacteria bacterium]